MVSKVARILLVAVFVAVAAIVTIVLFGGVAGEEFCPQRFTVRQFSYYQIPFLKLQITPVTFSTSSRGNSPLVNHLRRNQLLGASSNTLHWDVVSMSDVSQIADRGDAEILLKYLEQPGAKGAEDWFAWTKNPQHGEVSRLLWPLIGRLAREGLYILMPEIFDAARASDSAGEFLKLCRNRVAPIAHHLATAEQARQNAERAALITEVAEQLERSVQSQTKEPPGPVPNAEVSPEEVDL
jgi:hypothetical protein